MGLKGTSSPHVRRIRTSMMVLALVAQPFYALIHPAAAHAATAPVSPDNMSNWVVTDTTGNGGSVNFVSTVGSSGTGSAQFNLPNEDQSQSLRLAAYGTTKLADITTLGYDSYVQTGDAAAALLELIVDTNVTDNDTDSQSRLVYSPYQNGQVVAGEWQHQNARDGLWWFSDSDEFSLSCSQLSPCSLNTIITLYPNAGLAADGDINLTISNKDNDPAVSHIDSLVFNDDTYNFEAITAPQLVGPAHDATLSDSTVLATWQPVSTASQYVYESYNDEAATQLRVSEATVDTQKSEAGVAEGTSIWWRVKAVDSQGNAGNWSELRKVRVETKEEIPAAGVISGSDSGQTQELLTQLARLNEPFEIPNSLNTSFIIAPSVWNTIDTASDDGDMQGVQATGVPVTDQGAHTAAAVPTENGWKFFGVLWYWWMVPVMVFGALVIRMSVRPTRTFLYSSDQI